MLSHTIRLDLYEQSAQLLAVDFSTRRVVVRWGSGETAYVSGFEWHPDGWYRFECPQGWGPSAERLALVGGRGLGYVEDDLMIKPAGPGLMPLVNWLRDAGVPPSVYSNGSAQTRAIAEWILRLRTKLMHGHDLHELGEQHRATIIGAPRVDAILIPLITAGVCRPYCIDPRTVDASGGDNIRSARWLPLALASEVRGAIEHRNSPTYANTTDAEWSAVEARLADEWQALCRRFGVVKTVGRETHVVTAPVGTIYWSFTQGDAFDSIPEFSL